MKLDDGRPVRRAVSRHLVDDSLEAPRSLEAAAPRVGDPLRVLMAVGKVEPAVAFMDVRAFSEVRQGDLGHGAAERRHRVVEPRGEALFFAPEQIRLLANNDRRVDGVVVLGGERDVVGDERGAEGVAEGAGRTVGDRDADGPAVDGVVVHRHVPVEATGALDDGPCLGASTGPAELVHVQRGAVCAPREEIRGGEQQPVVHDVVVDAWRGLVVTGVEVHRLFMDDHRRIRGVHVPHDGVAHRRRLLRHGGDVPGFARRRPV